MNFDAGTLERAVLAIRLGAVTEQGLAQLQHRSMPVSSLAGRAALEAGLIRQVLSELAAEDELMWLFRVGVVRREVDGQGITDCFRLTPLGVRALTELRNTARPPVPIVEQLSNLVTRWLVR